MKTIGVYRITNKLTNQCYIGSSMNVKQMWTIHKCHSSWKKQKDNRLYQDFQMYGLNNFTFEVVEECTIKNLREREQAWIEVLQPSYNDRNAFQTVEKRKEYNKEYQKSEKRKAYLKEYHNQLCIYNNEEITLDALSHRFKRSGISNPTKEAKKYLK